MASPVPPNSPPTLHIVQSATLESLSADVQALAVDVQGCRNDIHGLHTALLGEGGVLQRTAAVEVAAGAKWPKLVISHGAVVALAGAVAELLRAHYPAFGSALQQIVKSLGAG